MADLAIAPAPVVAIATASAVAAKPQTQALFEGLMAGVAPIADTPVPVVRPPETAADLQALAPPVAETTDGDAIDPALAAMLAMLAPAPVAPAVVMVASGGATPTDPARPSVPLPDAAMVAVATDASVPTPVDPAKQAAAEAALSALVRGDAAAPATGAKAKAPPEPVQPAPAAEADAASPPEAVQHPRGGLRRTGDPKTPDLRADTSAPQATAPAAPLSLDGRTAPDTAAPATLSAPPLDGAAQAMHRALADARGDQWLDQLAHDIARTGGADSRLSFTLDPAHLGPVAVHIAQGSDGASVRMSARDDQTRTIIADAQPRLAAEARAQGLTLRETSVDVGGQGGQPSHQSRGGSALAQGFGGDASPQQRRPSPDHNLSDAMIAPERGPAVRRSGGAGRYA